MLLLVLLAVVLWCALSVPFGILVGRSLRSPDVDPPEPRRTTFELAA